MVTLRLIKITGALPTSIFNILAGDTVVGVAMLRHRKSRSADVPEGFESHVYYEVQEAFRGKGYATEALKLLVEEARKIGMAELLLTIAEDNQPSRHVAKANNASERQVKFSKNQRAYIQYRINV